MAKILIIDDDKMIADMLSRMVERMQHQAITARTCAAGRQQFGSPDIDVVLLDVVLPDGNGLDLVPELRRRTNAPEVIIITGEGEPDGAELAIKNGAWDYIEKPFSVDKITLLINRALQYRQEKKSPQSLVSLKRDGIIGNSPPIQSCLDLVARAASTDAPVMVLGETGTGKELFAWAIHENSQRRSGNFVVVDCAALPETLVESALFGHKKGAFTGADKDADGLIRQANGGTLFLDEIGELPLLMQKAFLRVLQEYRFRPIGSTAETQSDFRVVAASNRNLQGMVRQGLFRSDLLFRLGSLTIDLPPLRARTPDIKELTMYYVSRLCERYGMETKGFSPDIFDVLASYTWPGNVRELINVIEWILSSARHDPTLFPHHLPQNLRITHARGALSKPPAESSLATGADLPRLHDYRETVVLQAEKQYLHELLKQTGGNIKSACEISGLSRPRLYALLKKHALSPKSS